jgi:dolichyl-phosphate beta-glucosyltransferase
MQETSHVEHTPLAAGSGTARPAGDPMPLAQTELESKPASGSVVATELSVVVPMYREAKRIGATLQDLVATLRSSSRSSEIVLVNDGSDDATVSVVRPFLTESPAGGLARVRLVDYSPNAGKGHAVRAGLAAAKGRWRLLMDADNACRVGEVDKLFRAVTPEVGLVAGSRRALDAQVTADAFRKLSGAIFRVALWICGLDLLRDTQCGFKLYRGDLADEIVRYGRENGFAFDLEHLLLAKTAGLAIKEVGVAWVHQDGGTVDPVRDGLRMLYQAARIRRRWITDRPKIRLSPLPASVAEAKPGVPQGALEGSAPITAS